jgi:hypothetical protein
MSTRAPVDAVTNGDKSPVTSSAVARSVSLAGVPVGATLSFYSNTVPETFLPCNGVAFDENQYPALYAMLGDNHTPYSYDKSRLGDYEDFALSTTNQEMPYDGVMLLQMEVAAANNQQTKYVYVNDVAVVVPYIYEGNAYTTAVYESITIPFRKGDKIRTSTNPIRCKVAYYTHFNIIKATL